MGQEQGAEATRQRDLTLLGMGEGDPVVGETDELLQWPDGQALVECRSAWVHLSHVKR